MLLFWLEINDSAAELASVGCQKRCWTSSRLDEYARRKPSGVQSGASFNPSKVTGRNISFPS